MTCLSMEWFTACNGEHQLGHGLECCSACSESFSEKMRNAFPLNKHIYSCTSCLRIWHCNMRNCKEDQALLHLAREELCVHTLRQYCTALQMTHCCEASDVATALAAVLCSSDTSSGCVHAIAWPVASTSTTVEWRLWLQSTSQATQAQASSSLQLQLEHSADLHLS
jgi:hypothetical protein